MIIQVQNKLSRWMSRKKLTAKNSCWHQHTQIQHTTPILFNTMPFIQLKQMDTNTTRHGKTPEDFTVSCR